MKFSELYPHPIVTDFDVRRVVDDSRVVAPGDVFIFDQNVVSADGAPFVADALAKGAEAVITNMDGQTDPKVFFTETPGALLTKWAAAQYPQQPESIVAVTGTNGKTSVAWFYQEMCAALTGGKAASLGTLGVFQNGEKVAETGYTTPTALKLHEILQSLSQAGVQHACMEASSHALELHRMDGVRLKAAAFTNITPDHRDFHGSMENYFAAKARLFSAVLPEGTTAVLNIQKMESWPLASLCKERGLDVLTVGTGNAELVVAPMEYRLDGTKVNIRYDGQSTTAVLPLVGVFQAENVATALGLMLGSGFNWDDLVKALPAITPVPGRMEILEKNEDQPTVVVDYAHTPDALERALQALRPNVQGKLWVVFGCGGDRDAAKRPQMGEIAARLADKVVVTDDNPRTEAPAPIRDQIMAACPQAYNIGNRQEAIAYAIEHAGADDVVLVAGKGHESGQIVGKEVHPFDDRDVAREILKVGK